jgi:predicted MPP superfamily phosphohydrolase
VNSAVHNAVGLVLAMAFPTVVHKAVRHSSVRLSIFTSSGALILLVLAGITGVVVFGGTGFGAAQLLAWTVFLHVPVYQIGTGLALARRTPKVAIAHYATAIILGLVALDAFIIEPHWLQVSTLTLPSAKLTEPIRVVVLADIQTDRPGRYEARVLRTAMAQDPDLILFLGDYVHLGRRSVSYATEVEALRKLMVNSGLHAPLGAYAVAGNVDKPGIWTQAFDGLPVVPIEETTSYDLGQLVMTGLAMWDSFGTQAAVEAQDAFHIVIGHNPNFSLGPVEADLLIAGHTHGGQVQLPLVGPLLNMSRVPRSWVSGATTVATGKTLVVSRGIGMERANAPRLRFLCRPELVVINLVPAG